MEKYSEQLVLSWRQHAALDKDQVQWLRYLSVAQTCQLFAIKDEGKKGSPITCKGRRALAGFDARNFSVSQLRYGS